MPDEMRQAFEGAVGADNVRDGDAAYGVDGLQPRLVVTPPDIDRLSRTMAAAHEHETAVAPRGGGTRLDLGNPPERLDVVVDVSGLDRVVQHNPADLTATVEAGMTIDSLRHILGEQVQFLAIDPPLPDRATVGGTLAAGVSGPLKWQYGHPRDLVIGMKVVQADGTVTKSGGQVVKNVSGYDMSRLHTGGLGTLGIIAEVSFKLTPLPQNEATLVSSFDSGTNSLSAGLGIFHSAVTPLALTAFDTAVMQRAHLRVPDGTRFVAVRLGGRSRTLQRQLSECTSICREQGAVAVEEVDDGTAAALWRSLADFAWDETTRPVAAARASVPPSTVSELTDALESTSTNALQPATVSQPGFGHLQIAWYSKGGDVSAGDVATVLSDARDAAHKAGGHLVIERCPPEVKSRLDVWDDVGGPLAIMRRMKEQYDPGRILNPGRFAGGL